MSDVRLSQTFDLNRKTLAPLVEKCREVVFNACQVDVRVFVRQAMRLDDLPYKKAVEQLRMSNMSFCLMQNFNVKPDQLLGAPRKLFRFNRTSILTSKRHKWTEIFHNVCVSD